MKGKLVLSALVGISLMLSLSLIPAYASSHEKTLMIIFKDANDRSIKNAECMVKTNNFVYYTITNSYGFATIFLPNNTITASVECSAYDSSENMCDIILKRDTTMVVLRDNPYNIIESCS